MFNSEPVVRTRTWSAHWWRGTCRGFNLGIKLFEEKVMNAGSVWRVTKSICENVKADPMMRYQL